MTESSSRTYDSLHMGRSSIDLYSNDVGAPFVDITSFAAYVGGSPTNISVGAATGAAHGAVDRVRRGPGGRFHRALPPAGGRGHPVFGAQAGASHQRGDPGHRAAGQVSAGLLPGQLRRHRVDHRRRAGGAGGRQQSAPVCGHQSQQGSQPQRDHVRRGTGPAGGHGGGAGHRLPPGPVARPARLRRHHPRRAPPGRHRHRHRGRDQRPCSPTPAR